MSSLIVLPGSEEFKSTLDSLKNKKAPRAPRASTPPTPIDLAGRTLMLNTALAKTFQCGGFALGPNRPWGIVTGDAQQIPLHRALGEGKLIDVTGQDLTRKGFKMRGGQTSAVAEADTDKKAFMATDKHGNLYIATPRSKTEAKRWEKEIAKTGRITSADFAEETTGLGRVIEEPIETPQPVRKKSTFRKKAPSNVRPHRRIGISR